MYFIHSINLKNYRRFSDVNIPLGPKTVILGENNTGKSSLMYLLDQLLNPTKRGFQISEEDLTHKSKSQAVIEVKLDIRSDSGKKFNLEDTKFFGNHIDISKSGKHRLFLKLKCGIDDDSEEFRCRLYYIKSDGEEDGTVRFNEIHRIPFFLIPALRNAQRDLMSKGGLWGRLLSEFSVSQEKREKIREKSEKVAEELMSIIIGEQDFSNAKEGLVDFFRSVMWGSDKIGEMSFSAVPPNEKEFLQALQLVMRNPGDSSGFGMLEHGDGTQSMAVIALMMTYTNSIGYKDSIIAVEEPESHLHPHSARALATYLWNRPQQVILTTHSSEVANIVKSDQIVLLKRRGSETISRYIKKNVFTSTELGILNRYIQMAGSELYFSRCVLFTEGDSERLALPIFAKALGVQLDQLGVSLLSVTGAGDFKIFSKLLQKDSLDIPSIIMCDNDKAGIQVAKHLKELGEIDFDVESSNLESRREKLEEAGLYILPNGNFEEYIMESGYVNEYEEAISEIFGIGALDAYIQKLEKEKSGLEFSKLDRKSKILKFITRKRRKPELAISVAERITKNGVDKSKIPSYFVKVLSSIEKMAKEEVELEVKGTS